jgi:ferritin
MALDEEDWATWNLQWFVKEQIEEENLANYLIKLHLQVVKMQKVMLCINWIKI